MELDDELTLSDLQGLGDDLRRDGIRLRYEGRPRGDSMRPFIKPGDLVTVEQVQPHAIRVLDILVFRTGPRRTCAHRVQAIDAGSGQRIFRTRGDGRIDPDPPVRETDVIGRVRSIQRKGRTHRVDSLWMRFCVRLWLLIHPWPHRMVRWIHR